MFYISFSLHILPTFIERGGSFLVSNSYPELVGVGMLPYLIIYREKEKEKKSPECNKFPNTPLFI